jgi:phosphate uptake regulator
MEHTVRSFSQDLEELTGDLARMGGLAEDMLSGRHSGDRHPRPRAR